MNWRQRDDGWFTWFECPNCGAREFSRRPVCACCHVRLGKDEEPPGGAENIANDISPERNVDEMSVTEYRTMKEAVVDIIERTNAKIKKIKERTNGMKQENIYMLQYVAGALHGISTVLTDSDVDLKNVLGGLSEEVSNVVINETVGREKVSIYMDDGGDDGK